MSIGLFLLEAAILNCANDPGENRRYNSHSNQNVGEETPVRDTTVTPVPSTPQSKNPEKQTCAGDSDCYGVDQF